MGEYLLGIDIGTSACKIAVFAKDGTVKATGTGDYQVYYPHPGWAEQNPEEWWEAVCDAIPRVLVKGNISPEEIKGIGIDGQSWSAIAVDKDLRALRQLFAAILYNCKDHLVSEKSAGSLCKDL